MGVFVFAFQPIAVSLFSLWLQHRRCCRNLRRTTSDPRMSPGLLAQSFFPLLWEKNGHRNEICHRPVVLSFPWRKPFPHSCTAKLIWQNGGKKKSGVTKNFLSYGCRAARGSGRYIRKFVKVESHVVSQKTCRWKMEDVKEAVGTSCWGVTSKSHGGQVQQHHCSGRICSLGKLYWVRFKISVVANIWSWVFTTMPWRTSARIKYKKN